jgi:hypothetical protein
MRYIDDNRAVLIYNIKDYEAGFFASIGDSVEVVDKNKDEMSPSGYSYLVKHGIAGRLYHVDPVYLIPHSDWVRIYNRVVELCLSDIKKEMVSI